MEGYLFFILLCFKAKILIAVHAFLKNFYKKHKLAFKIFVVRDAISCIKHVCFADEINT